MAQQFVLAALVVLTVFGTFCKAGGSHHKHIIIHVPYHIKHHHHTHTIYKHIKHIDHGHDHHHHDEITIPDGWVFGGGWSGGDSGWANSGGDNGWSGSGASYDGGFDSGKYENNNFGSLGWEDK